MRPGPVPVRPAAVLVLLALAACGPGGPPSSGESGPSRVVVAALEDRLLRAMLQADTTTLAALWAPDYVSTSAVGHTTTRAEGLMAYGVGLVRVDAASVTDLDVRGYGRSAVALGTLEWRGMAAGGPFSGTARFLHVWVRQADGAWRLTASQRTGVPAGGPGGRP